MIKRLAPIFSKHYKLLCNVSQSTEAHFSTTKLNMGSSQSSNQELEFVQQEVDDNCVVIFSKTTCGFCHMAKGVFDGMGTPYKAIELNRLENGSQIQQALTQLTGATTVPRVFINGKCIGGGSETKQLHKDGKLLELLAQCQTDNVPSSNL